MARSRRLSAQWFQRGLWLVALAFAACLLGLGSLVIEDLPRVETLAQRDDFIDKPAVAPLRATIRDARTAETAASDALDQATLKLQAAQKAYANARDAFGNWLDTRKATNLPSRDEELVARTAALDAVKAAQADAQRVVDNQNEAVLDAQQAGQAAQRKLAVLEDEADHRLDAAQRTAELRIFGYRLALTLPLLALSYWLLRTQRNGAWWPFAWGFIIFSLYAFFVELVPYMPSYGGYVQYGVGLIITVLVGRGVIVALNGYLARQKLAEQQPDTLRRNELDYEIALVRLGKGLCPGCERAVDLKNEENAFCPHCGIGLYNSCPHCATRKSAFSPFCPVCGARAAEASAGTDTTPA